MTASLPLFHQTFGDWMPGQNGTVVILHGLLGSSTNWRSIARKLETHHPVLLPDARNHGQSPHAEDMSYPAQANDVIALLDELDLPSVHLLGHSMGGKTAMALACLAPDRIRSLTVADIAPVAYDTDPNSPQRRLMEAMTSLDITELESRKAADRALATTVDDAALRAFALLGLERADDGFRWRANVPRLLETLPIMRGVPDALQNGYQGPTLFVYGAQSHYVLAEHHSLIRDKFPKVQFSEIAQAGHWLHAEQPAAFVSTVLAFLKNVGGSSPR